MYIPKQLNIIKMKKVLLTIAVLFTAASISLACSEEKKACCKSKTAETKPAEEKK